VIYPDGTVPPGNCNVPKRLWAARNNSRYQHAAYMGNTADAMASVYQAIVRNKWRFAANEGSLEDLFPKVSDHFSVLFFL
jgi:hypothetical protein